MAVLRHTAHLGVEVRRLRATRVTGGAVRRGTSVSRKQNRVYDCFVDLEQNEHLRVESVLDVLAAVEIDRRVVLQVHQIVVRLRTASTRQLRRRWW